MMEYAPPALDMIRKLVRAGKTPIEIARELGWSPRTLAERCQRHSISLSVQTVQVGDGGGRDRGPMTFPKRSVWPDSRQR